jgi:hypothetical protein
MVAAFLRRLADWGTRWRVVADFVCERAPEDAIRETTDKHREGKNDECGMMNDEPEKPHQASLPEFIMRHLAFIVSAVCVH